MHSFQAKIGLEKLRKGENKNYRFVSFRSCPTRNRKFQKKVKKIQKKKKKYHYGSFQAKIGWKRMGMRE